MNAKQNNSPESNFENEIDKLGDMFHAMLAKGDDEYYEAAKSSREGQAKKSKCQSLNAEEVSECRML